MTTIVLGAQWGDEGKGKLTDLLCSSMSICARSQGGHNAGHTIVADGIKFDVHLIPSGIVTPGVKNLVGSGCVVHVPSFLQELESLKSKGVNTEGRIWISDRAHVIFDMHLLADKLEEKRLREGRSGKNIVNGEKGGKEIGTTMKGIGPCYTTKAARVGVRLHQVLDNREEMNKWLRAMAEDMKNRYDGFEGYDVDEEIERFDRYRETLQQYRIDAVLMMGEAQAADKPILVEGANALMLDIDHGTYPFVTSSSTSTGGAISGLGINPLKIKEIIGVVKAYTTRVGGGPFPTEQHEEAGHKLQTIGHEIGTTTGRPRRCGWLDLVALKYSHAVNHYTSLNLTKLDVLDSFPSIKVAVAYKHSSDGSLLKSFPANLDVLEACEVVYEELPGWESDTTGAKTFEDLPDNARAYVSFVEERVGVRVKFIGTGPGRKDLIFR